MRYQKNCVTLLIFTLFSAVGLSGCSGLDGAAFPAVSIPSAPVTSSAIVSPPLQGSVYGGHAPLIGAKVYVLSPSTTALYGQSISLMDGDTQKIQV